MNKNPKELAELYAKAAFDSCKYINTINREGKK